MAVHEITGLREPEIWHQLGYALGLGYHQQWWSEYNLTRQMHGGMIQFPQIFVLSPEAETAEDTVV